jgi:hypothetical protein
VFSLLLWDRTWADEEEHLTVVMGQDRTWADEEEHLAGGTEMLRH